MLEIQQNFQEAIERYGQIFEKIHNNTRDMVRPITAQENLLREGFAPTQISTPLERLVHLEEDSLQQLQNLLGFSRQLNKMNLQIQEQYTRFPEQMALVSEKLEKIEDLLLSAAAVFQSNFPEKKFVQEQFVELIKRQDDSFDRLIHYCERIANNSDNLLKRQQEITERTNKSRQNESFLFWAVVIILIFLFIFSLILKS